MQCKPLVLTVGSSWVRVTLAAVLMLLLVLNLRRLSVFKTPNKLFKVLVQLLSQVSLQSFALSANVCRNSESTDTWMWVNGVSDRVWGQEPVAAGGGAVGAPCPKKRPNISVWHQSKHVPWLLCSLITCSLWNCQTLRNILLNDKQWSAINAIILLKFTMNFALLASGIYEENL